MADSIIFLDESRVEQLLSLQELIPAIEKGLGRFSDSLNGGVVQPVRTVIPLTKYNSFFGSMPVYSDQDNSVGAKMVFFSRGNAEKGLGTHQALIVLFNVETGVPQAVMDGNLITSLRTAAASAVALKYLAHKDSQILCILGSGVQAHSHLRAFKEVMDIKELRIWNRTKSNAIKFADEAQKSLAKVKVCETVAEAARGADVVLTVTMSPKPVLCGDWLKEGAFVCIVGACTAAWRETDDAVMKNSLVVVDSRQSAEKESGDIIQSGVSVFAELGELINQSKSIPPEKLEKKFIVFKSSGIAVEDIVSAKLVLQKHLGAKK